MQTEITISMLEKMLKLRAASSHAHSEHKKAESSISSVESEEKFIPYYEEPKCIAVQTSEQKALCDEIGIQVDLLTKVEPKIIYIKTEGGTTSDHIIPSEIFKETKAKVTDDTNKFELFIFVTS